MVQVGRGGRLHPSLPPRRRMLVWYRPCRQATLWAHHLQLHSATLLVLRLSMGVAPEPNTGRPMWELPAFLGFTPPTTCKQGPARRGRCSAHEAQAVLGGTPPSSCWALRVALCTDSSLWQPCPASPENGSRTSLAAAAVLKAHWPLRPWQIQAVNLASRPACTPGVPPPIACPNPHNGRHAGCLLALTG